jgi:hypothetical protein
VFLVMLAWLALYGPGVLSLDHFLARWLGVGKEEAPPRPVREAA